MAHLGQSGAASKPFSRGLQGLFPPELSPSVLNLGPYLTLPLLIPRQQRPPGSAPRGTSGRAASHHSQPHPRPRPSSSNSRGTRETPWGLFHKGTNLIHGDSPS